MDALTVSAMMDAVDARMLRAATVRLSVVATMAHAVVTQTVRQAYVPVPADPILAPIAMQDVVTVAVHRHHLRRHAAMALAAPAVLTHAVLAAATAAVASVGAHLTAHRHVVAVAAAVAVVVDADKFLMHNS